VYLGNSAFQICDQLLERAGNCLVRAPDQNIVPAFAPFDTENHTCDFAKAAFGAVAGDCITDFLGTGVANAGGIFVITETGLQQEPGLPRAFGASRA
jgi:hypothetical protein